MHGGRWIDSWMDGWKDGCTGTLTDGKIDRGRWKEDGWMMGR